MVSMRKKGILVFVLVLLSTFLVMGEGEAEANIEKTIGDLHIKPGTDVDGDVTLNIGNLTVDGTINGDVILDMGDLRVDGDVHGDVSCNLGKITINGNVDGDVNANLGEVIVKGNVGGNLHGGTGSVIIEGEVGGDVRTRLGNIDISGNVKGDVNSEGKKVNISGEVEGDVYLPRGIVNLEPGAIVRGEIRVDRGMVEVEPGAEVGEIRVEEELSRAQIEDMFTLDGVSFRGLDRINEFVPFLNFQLDLDRRTPGALDIINYWKATWMGVLGNLVRSMVSMAVFFALSVLVFTLFPGHVANVQKVMETNTSKVVLWGVLATLLAIPLAILLTITIIGIPLILVEILALMVAFMLGYVGLVKLLGERLFQQLSKSGQPIGMIGVGVVIIGLIAMIPFVGAFVSLGAFILAVGAAFFSRFGSQV